VLASLTVSLIAQAPAGRGGQAGRGGGPPPGPNLNQYYTLGPDSLPREGVPKGEVRGPFYLLDSPNYPGTQHTYWVYVPAQYDPAVEADLMIFQDAHAYIDMEGSVRVPNVLDHLIYRRDLPVMIAAFINPGRTPEQPEPGSGWWGDGTTNRVQEYNARDDKYAKVIVEELLPALNRDYTISADPLRRGIGGAIAAFTVAWRYPDLFSKVLSIVGSFVNIREGDTYPDIIRKSEKKPLRIFLNDGRDDLRGTGRGGSYDERRDWFLQNVRIKDALEEKGYDLNYI